MSNAAVALQEGVVAQDLEIRIADAFDAKLSSKALRELLAEVDRADQEAQEESRRANAIALDPATRPDAVTAARKLMEDADFRRLRMERAKDKLTELQKAAVRREQAEARKLEADAAVAERDQLAKDLLEYDQLSRKIVVLLIRLSQNNARVGAFQSAEIIARDAGADWAVNVDTTLPKLLENTRLPKLRRDGSNHGFMWPPQ